LGPNALGGAINLVSRKPASPFELDASTGIILHGEGWGGWQSNLNVGSKKERFYFQGGLGFVERKPFALSRKTDLVNRTQPVLQDNSQQRDIKYSMKAGFTPNKTDSYVISVHLQDGSKGVPPTLAKIPTSVPGSGDSLQSGSTGFILTA
jgi:iron complex outermembrane recepter protein